MTAVLSVLSGLLAAASCLSYLTTPSKHLFGGLNFALFKNDTHKIPFNELETNNLGYEPKGISLSFYVDSVNASETLHKVFTVYGVDIHVNINTAGDKCDIIIVTQFKFNITYPLKHCNKRTHVILDLYDKSERIISSLYENLVLAYGHESRGWCKYDDTFLKECTSILYKPADYSYSAANNTLEEVKKICLGITSIEGELCRGITLMDNNNYTLRVGDVPKPSLADNETTYQNGPCLDDGYTEKEPSWVLELHKTKTLVQLSHINIDPLRALNASEERTRRWKRYELGNMNPGLLLNFENFERGNVSYNTSFIVETNSSLQYFFMSQENTTTAVISEGMFIQELQGGKYFQLNENNVNFAWVIGNELFTELRYCEFGSGEIAMKDVCLNSTSCCGVSSNGTQVETCNSSNELLMRKGVCKDPAGAEKFKISKGPLMPANEIKKTFGKYNYIVGFFFRSLPKINNIFVKQNASECKFTRTNHYSSDIRAIFSLVTSHDGYRLLVNYKVDNATELFVKVNTSDDQAIMHLMMLNNSVESVSLTSMVGDECTLNMDTFTADICDADLKEDDYGYYFLKRANFEETVKVACRGSVDISSSYTTWSCQNGSWVQPISSQRCPFYQCYDGEALTHNQTFTNATNVRRTSNDKTRDGVCCGGQWNFSCEEDYSIKYGNCSELQPCLGSQKIKFNVTEGNGENSTASVTTTTLIFANNEMEVNCEHSSGKVALECDGCRGQRTVSKHTCKAQFCLQEGKEKLFNLTWNEAETIKYGTSFNYTVKWPFAYYNTSKVGCPYGGSLNITCHDAQFKTDFITSCTPAPKCPEEKFHLHPLKGKGNFTSVYAGESSRTACPVNPDEISTRFCNASGDWESPDHSNCDMDPCKSIDFVDRNVSFSTGETNPNKYSNTSCKLESLVCDGGNCKQLEMCFEGICGQRRCNSTSGGYDKPDYSSCGFNCTYKEKSIQHKSYRAFFCSRTNGDTGIEYVECHNGVPKAGPCVLKTCPYAGGVGCVETNPEKLEDAVSSELVADLSSFLDNVNLSSPQAMKDTENVINAIMWNLPDSPAEISQEDTAKTLDVVNKISINLAEFGGKIITESVKMFGIPSAAAGKLENSYLSDNGIEGSGYNGSIGLSVFTKKDLFKPKNTTKEKLGSTFVKSVITEFNSSDIRINITFPLTRKYSTSALRCTYLDPLSGEWLSDGCTPYFTADNRTTICYCTHLTSFAVLVSLDMINDAKQSLATKIMLTISIASLSATIIAIAPFRKLRQRDIIRLHLNLIGSTLVANLAFLSLDAAVGSSGFCHFTTFLTHFAWLSVFGWMITEGVTMYKQTVRALKSYGKRMDYYTLKCAICVHGGALVPPLVGLILASSWDGFHYITPDYEYVCFLDSPTTIVYLFLGPLYIVLCFSVYFFVRVSVVVVNSKRHSTSKSVDEGNFWRKQLKAVLSISTVTGIAWIIAPFVIMGETGGHFSIAMQWIFNIFLGLQGVVAFIVLVVFSEDVRKCWHDIYTESPVAKFGEAFVSIGGILSTFQNRKKRSEKYELTTASQPITQTKSTNFMSNCGRSRDNLLLNPFSKVSISSFLDLGMQANSLSEVFSPVEISPVQLRNEAWVKFVEFAQIGVIPVVGAIVTTDQDGDQVDSQRKDIASDSGFHGDDDINTHC